MVAASLKFGEIVSWSSPTEVAFTVVQQALVKAGLDKDFARDMLPRNAFARAARKLEGRLFDTVTDEGNTLRVQVTRQYLDEVAKEVDYVKEAFLELNKTTGTVTSPNNPALASLVETRLHEEIAVRHAHDITNLVQRIFDRHSGDLVPIRPSGGAYFVPQSQHELTVRIESFLEEVGGTIVRFGVSGGEDSKTAQSIADSMNSYFENMVSEFKRTCEDVSPETSARVIENRHAKLKGLQFKLETMKEYLANHAEGIQKALDNAHGYLEGKRSSATPSLFGSSEKTADAEPVVEETDEALALSF